MVTTQVTETLKTPAGVIEDAKLRARTHPLQRSIVPLHGCSMLSVYFCGQGVFLYGHNKAGGELVYTTDEDKAIAIVEEGR